MRHLQQLNSDWIYPLKHRIIWALAAGLAATMLILGFALGGFLLRESERHTRELSNTIAASLKKFMLTRNPEEIQGVLESIANSEDTSIVRAFVLDSSGQVVFSSDPSQRKRRFDRMADPSCIGCHQRIEQAPTQHTTITLSEGRRVQRNVKVLLNEPECYGCHDAQVRATGKLIIDRSLSDTAAVIAQVEGIVLVLGMLSLLVLSRFIARGANRYIREIVNQGEELTSLYVLVESLSKTIDRKELKQVVVRVLSELLQAGEVDVVTLDDRRGVRCATWTKASGQMVRKKLDEGSVLAAAVEAWRGGGESEPALAQGGAEILMPIAKSDTPLVFFAVRGLAQPFAEERLWFLQVMMKHIAAAFDNARLYTMAITDEMTTLFTRRHFDYCIERRFAEAQEHRASLSVLMIDVDEFKQFNDTYGHVVGDSVLEAVGRGIQNAVRDADLAFRYGGEEFMVILPSTDAAGGVIVGERVRAAVAALALQNCPASVTISLGLATWPNHVKTLQDLIRSADDALYQAKRSGRNRLIVSA